MKLNTLSLMLASAILTACGGGSSSTEEKPPTVTPPVVSITKDEAMTQLLAAQADNYILPAYTAVKNQADAFEQASLTFCSYSTPSTTELSELKSAWFSLSDAWQYAKAIKMGPESEQFRHFRMQFWPDSSNAVMRGVASLLAAQDINVNTVENLQDGAQGLPALEQLIFDDSTERSLLTADNKFDRCLAVIAIAANVKNISNEILSLWTEPNSGFVNDFKNGTGSYETQQAVLEDFVTNWFEIIEVIKDNKINDVKGSVLPGYAEKAENHLSLSSLTNIKTNFAGLELAYLGGDGYGFDQYLTDIHDNTEVNQVILSHFADINTLIDAIDIPLSQAVALEDGREKLTELNLKIDEFRAYMSTDFIQITDLNPNFNSNDGD